MKMVKSLLLGTAAGLVAMTGAQAADLPVKAKPVQYVKICSLYGAGFYYIPGTDTCIKIGGFVRAEVNFNAGGSFAPQFVNQQDRSTTSTTVPVGGTNNWRSRAGITADARSQTEYGTLRGYVYLAATSTNSVGGGTGTGNTTGASAYTQLYAPVGFIQFAGFTAGKTGSFFDFDGQPYSNQSNIWSSNNGGNGVDLFAYTAQLGNGLSASISAENNFGHRLGVIGGNTVATGRFNPNTGVAEVRNVANSGDGYAGQEMPDLVANLRVDQAWGSAQIMGAAHEIRTGSFTLGNNASGTPGNKWGYAFGAGAKVNLPMLGKGDYIQAQFTYGVGAMDYVGSGLGNTQTTDRGNVSFGPAYDAVYGVAGSGLFDLTTGWSITGGYEHNWVPGWKTSLFGAYGKLEYSAAASAQLLGQGVGATVAAGVPVGSVASATGGSANWSYWQVGSRTVWTPVTNLDLSVEVMYQKSVTAFTGPGVGDNSWFSGMFRAQRNFYP